MDKNHITGELPLSLQNCTAMVFLDLGEHRLLGSVPTWIGENLQNLMILALKYNEFNGSIPLQFCQLKYLNIASNNLSRTIPWCAFIDTSFRDTLTLMYLPYKIYYNYIFQHVFPLAKSLDLSSSKLTRQIPKEVMSLVGLKNLNLSTNHLVTNPTKHCRNERTGVSWFVKEPPFIHHPPLAWLIWHSL